MSSVIDGSDNFDTGTDLVALSGADLTAVGIVGANPYASLCKRDGSIVGGSDNGTFTKWANGNLECNGITDNGVSSTATGNIFRGSQISVTFPILFIAVPNVYTDLLTLLSAFGWATAYNTTVDTTKTMLLASVNNVESLINWTSIGRWK